jgi:hypothetical protein
MLLDERQGGKVAAPGGRGVFYFIVVYRTEC